jgi:hypothetical protein
LSLLASNKSVAPCRARSLLRNRGEDNELRTGGVRCHMGFFWRRGERIPAADPVLIEVPEPTSEEARRTLLRVTSEALILQDEADAVLAGVRTRQHMGVLAPRAGPLVRRFFAMRDLLPERYADPEAERLRALLDSILHHHALLLSMALDLLAYEWRSERIAAQVDAIDGMGAPGGWLEDMYAELTAQQPSAADDRNPQLHRFPEQIS